MRSASIDDHDKFLPHLFVLHFLMSPLQEKKFKLLFLFIYEPIKILYLNNCQLKEDLQS